MRTRNKQIRKLIYTEKYKDKVQNKHNKTMNLFGAQRTLSSEITLFKH